MAVLFFGLKNPNATAGHLTLAGLKTSVTFKTGGTG
jgi:hypothetical protein